MKPSGFVVPRRAGIVLLLAFACTAPATAHEEVSEKLGTVHFPISCGEHVQRDFNRALAMFYNFWFPNTNKAFEEIARAEPDCVMAYWGFALAQRSNPLVGAPPADAMTRGWEAMQKAKTLPAKTPRERDYLAALDVYYRDWKEIDHRTRVLAYEQAMEQLHLRYSGDSEAAVLYALALNEAIAVLPADKTFARQLKAAGILEAVLSKQPEHPGALHFLIHSYDFPALADRGIDAARLYGSAATSAPHALHMPSHIYSMLGMWPESIQANRSALGVAKTYVHAIDFMVYAHLQSAQDREAERLLRESIALQASGGAAQRTPTGAVLTVYTAYAAIPARYALERGAWAEAAALELRPRSAPADAITRFVRAMGLARLGDAVGARTEIDALRVLHDELIQSKQDYWAEQVEIQHRAASAWAALAEGRHAEALSLMTAAADAEDASEKHVAMENRLWPMREILGELLLELGRPAEALAAFEPSLDAARNRMRGFHGAATAAQLIGDAEKAAHYYGEILKLASHADSPRREIDAARAYLATR